MCSGQTTTGVLEKHAFRSHSHTVYAYCSTRLGILVCLCLPHIRVDPSHDPWRHAEPTQHTNNQINDVRPQLAPPRHAAIRAPDRPGHLHDASIRRRQPVAQRRILQHRVLLVVPAARHKRRPPHKNRLVAKQYAQTSKTLQRPKQQWPVICLHRVVQRRRPPRRLRPRHETHKPAGHYSRIPQRRRNHRHPILRHHRIRVHEPQHRAGRAGRARVHLRGARRHGDRSQNQRGPRGAWGEERGGVG
mmetsp:Transcript_6740/g.16345  ORF Transcript_6740/g.16345 Transcript_6740/m.16345 type:complete len:246 (+) Transcript_6740:2067-2804(+)